MRTVRRLVLTRVDACREGLVTGTVIRQQHIDKRADVARASPEQVNCFAARLTLASKALPDGGVSLAAGRTSLPEDLLRYVRFVSPAARR
jgi:hypothetical protein